MMRLLIGFGAIDSLEIGYLDRLRRSESVLGRQRRSGRADYDIAQVYSEVGRHRRGSGSVYEIGGDGTGGRRATSECVPRER